MEDETDAYSLLEPHAHYFFLRYPEENARVKDPSDLARLTKLGLKLVEISKAGDYEEKLDKLPYAEWEKVDHLLLLMCRCNIQTEYEPGSFEVAPHQYGSAWILIVMVVAFIIWLIVTQ